MKNTLLSFTATWCKPCQNMKPIIDNMEHLGYTVERYDIELNDDIRKEYKINSVPTFIILDEDDNEKYRITGSTTLVNLTKHMEE